jgi:hypothetical protein
LLKKIENLEDPGVDERVILRWIYRKWDGGKGHGLDRSGSGSGQAKDAMNLRVPQNAGNFLTS